MKAKVNQSHHENTGETKDDLVKFHNLSLIQRYISQQIKDSQPSTSTTNLTVN
jgi:hypothetical protein